MRGVVCAALLISLALTACSSSDETETKPAETKPAPIPNQLQQEKIAFIRPRDVPKIFVMNPDGTEQKPVTRSRPPGPFPESPTFSPDGRFIAFTGFLHREDDREVYVVDVNGGHERRLTRNVTHELAVDWLPDGRIVFVSCPTTRWRDEPPECDLVAMRRDGSNRETVSKFGFSFDIAVSPDGRRVAYSELEGQSHFQHFELHVANLDGSDQRQLTDDDTGDGSPAWSPDGERIAFVSNRAESAPCFFHDCEGFTNELYVMDSDGSELARVTETLDEEMTPSWSPDGEKIVYVRVARGARHDLYVVNVDGSCPTRLVPGTIPDWYGPAGTEGEPLDC